MKKVYKIHTIVSIFVLSNEKNMKQQFTNTVNLKVNNVITFTNDVNYKVSIKVSRVSDKSWYDEINGRYSYGTLLSWMKYKDFQITQG